MRTRTTDAAPNPALVRVKRIAAERASGFFDNPTSKRDFRVQMRGWRIPILLALYLIVLTGVTLLAYADIVRTQGDLQSAQRALTQFYFTISLTIATVISLVVPAMSGTTVVLEKSRGSLDLLFSAPVKPESFLLGKLLAIMRFVAMMLALSLPASAAALMLGGASLFDLLAASFLQFLGATVLGALGLSVSSRAKDPVRGLISSYAAAGIYLGIVSSFLGMAQWEGIAIADRTVTFLTQLSPFGAALASGTMSGPFGLPLIPNLFLTTAFTFLFVRFLLKGAALALTPAGRADVTGFRAQSLLWWAVAGAIPAFAFARSEMRGAEPWVVNAFAALAAGVLAPILTVLAIWVAGFGKDGARRDRPDGAFSFRTALAGRPSGSWPYLFCATVATVVGGVATTLLGFPTQPLDRAGGIVAGASYALAIATFFWSIGRYFSARTLSVTTGRIGAFAAAIGLGVAPPFLISALSDWRTDSPLYDITLFGPFMRMEQPGFLLYTGIMTGVLFLLSFVIELAGQVSLAKNLARDGAKRAKRLAEEEAIARRRGGETAGAER